MISNTISFNESTTKVTDRSVVASTCSLGFSLSFDATGVSHGVAKVSLRPLTGLPVLGRNERPTVALEAGVAEAKGKFYAFAATGAGFMKQTHDHMTWAFRGLEPWSDPA
ncbi:hypothetical protein ABT354_07835 [Streptomyces sp. NPDC000594]|uniref:hypothetical protein n=1 Tax=Streptomyces sp. NPDC000594 TaxID=3154261 RepID=UPI00332E3F59